jgi:hypothetical protein
VAGQKEIMVGKLPIRFKPEAPPPVPLKNLIIDPAIIALGKGKVYADPVIVRLYAREDSGLESTELPQAVVFAESTEDVSKLLSFA